MHVATRLYIIYFRFGLDIVDGSAAEVPEAGVNVGLNEAEISLYVELEEVGIIGSAGPITGLVAGSAIAAVGWFVELEVADFSVHSTYVNDMKITVNNGKANKIKRNSIPYRVWRFSE